MQIQAAYPTREHQAAAAAIVEFFVTAYDIEAVLLVNSCARGRATRDSCLDIVVLAKPEVLASQRSAWEQAWEDFDAIHPTIQDLRGVGAYSVVHFGFFDVVYQPAHVSDCLQ